MRSVKFSFLFIIAFVGMCFSQIPQTMVYQGKLTDMSGIGQNDTLPMTFSIFDTVAGGTALWNEAHTGTDEVPVLRGLFSVTLGDIAALDIPFDAQYWLEIEVDGHVLSPRVRFTTSPYVFRAAVADSFTGGVAPWTQDTMIAHWDSLRHIPADIADGDDVDDADSDPTNELITDFTWDDPSNQLTITEAGTPQSVTIDNEADDLSDNSINDLLDVDATPSENQILVWDGAHWIAVSPPYGPGDITAVYAGYGLSGGGEFADVTLNIDEDYLGDLYIELDDNLAGDVTGLYDATQIASGVVIEEDLNATNLPLDNDILSYDAISGGFTWITDDDQTIAEKDTMIADWDSLRNIPLDFADGIDDTGHFEPNTIDTNIAHWDSIRNIPADIADGDDDTQLSEVEVETYITNGVIDLAGGSTVDGAVLNEWTDLTNIPADIADGDDIVDVIDTMIADWDSLRHIPADIADGDDTDDNVSAAELDGVFGTTGLLNRTGVATYNTVAEGDGGGLDADLLDGLHGNQFLRRDANTTQDDGFRIATDQLCARDASGLALFDMASTPGIFIENGGHVGIGILSPTEMLDVNGNTHISGDLTVDGSYPVDNDWIITTSIGDGTDDTTLVVSGHWGIFRSGSFAYGNVCSTYVNLGVACTTGESGENWKYCTVGGGLENTASVNFSTVAGGLENTASGSFSTVAGGNQNIASHTRSTVGGGYRNTASGFDATVCGGDQNTASGLDAVVGGGLQNAAGGECATIPGGFADTVSGDYSFAFGRHVVVPGDYNAQFFSADYPGTLSAHGNIYAEHDITTGTGTSIIYAYSNVTNNDATSWTYDDANAGIKGYLDNGGQYTASILGIYDGISNPSAAVLGTYHTGTSELGALAYYDGTNYIGVYGKQGILGDYAGYFDGDVNINGDLTITGSFTTDNDWVISTAIGDGTDDTTLVTGGRWGLFRNGNVGFGINCSTHVNLGVSCTTGTDGFNFMYTTVSGGFLNAASSNYSSIGGGMLNSATGNSSTVSGGFGNDANGDYSVIGGGIGNIANHHYSTIGGGYDNVASGLYSSVGGGDGNVASGDCATIPGGYADTVSGDYSFAFGRHAVVPASEDYSVVFNWDSYNGTVFIETDAISTSYKLYVNGNAFATGVWTPSDLKLKENITNCENGLDAISNLRPVHYRWKEDNRAGIGFIAQELEQVFPELVSVSNNETGMKAINYNGIIPVNTAAIQQLIEKVERLESENEALKARLDAIENEIEDK